MAVSEGIIIRSSRERREPIKLIVCASRSPNQSSRTSRPSMVMMTWGRPSHAAAFSVIRWTWPSRSVTAATSAGSSVAGSRLRGHQPPSSTPSAVDEHGNTSRRSCCADVTRRAALCGEFPRTDVMSVLPPPVPNPAACADDDSDVDVGARYAASHRTLLPSVRFKCRETAARQARRCRHHRRERRGATAVRTRRARGTAGPGGRGGRSMSAVGGDSGQALLAGPANVVGPAELLQGPDDPGGDVDLAGADAVAGAGGVGVVQVVP